MGDTRLKAEVRGAGPADWAALRDSDVTAEWTVSSSLSVVSALRGHVNGLNDS